MFSSRAAHLFDSKARNRLTVIADILLQQVTGEFLKSGFHRGVTTLSVYPSPGPGIFTSVT